MMGVKEYLDKVAYIGKPEILDDGYIYYSKFDGGVK